MSEPTNSDMRVWVAPKRRDVDLKDLTIRMRVPHNPTATAVFTADEQQEAEQYATEHGGIYTPLPVSDGVWDWETGTWIGNAEQ